MATAINRRSCKSSAAKDKNEDEQSLVQRAKQGDTEAYGQLFRNYHVLVWKVLLKRLRNRADADDLAQEAWLRGLRGIRGLKDEARFRSWILAIAMNVAVERDRGAARRALVNVGPQPLATLPAVGSTAQEMVERSELTGLIHQIAESALNPRFWVTYQGWRDGSTAREMAQNQGVCSKTLESRIRLVKKKLRLVLEQRGITRP